MNDRETLNTFLSEQQYMTLAVTLADGQPWATPVRIKHRDGRMFEWYSQTGAEHSKAIAARPLVALSIFTPQTDSTAQFGFYAQATAELLDEHDKVGHYRATVTRSWINDATLVKREVELG